MSGTKRLRGLFRRLFRGQVPLRSLDLLIFVNLHVLILAPLLSGAVGSVHASRAVMSGCACWAMLAYPLVFASERHHRLLHLSLRAYLFRRLSGLVISWLGLILSPLLLLRFLLAHWRNRKAG